MQALIRLFRQPFFHYIVNRQGEGSISDFRNNRAKKLLRFLIVFNNNFNAKTRKEVVMILASFLLTVI